MSKEERVEWIKSSFSFANGNCVEVAFLPDGGIGVRNSRNLSGEKLVFTRAEWRAFLGGVFNGEFDLFGKGWVEIPGLWLCTP